MAGKRKSEAAKELITLPPLSPADYQAALEALILNNICIESLSARCDRSKIDQPNININVKTRAMAEQACDRYTVICGYLLEGKSEDAEALSIEVAFRLEFGCTKLIPEGFFEIYKDTSLPVTTLPYLREIVASMTSRMNIPALTLPYTIFPPAIRSPAPPA